MSSKKVLTMQTINPNLVEMQYAVRGLVPTTAGEIAKEFEDNAESAKSKYTFDEILYCNIGNPQSVGQLPITYYRDVLALVDAPHLLEKGDVSKVFADDVISKAKSILAQLKVGTGAYSHSQGVQGFRDNVAAFIEKRDGYPCDANNLFLTNGASTGIQMILTAVISSPDVGVLIPIPQYPIYSALIKLLNGTQLNYNLLEDKAWAIDMNDLKKTVDDSRKAGVKPRVMVIINPGNPTGSVLDLEQLKELVRFCKDENLLLLADEVYQENVYFPNQQFHSVKKVVRSLGPEYDDFEFVSFHSTSKGLIGECGRRGGYMEICGFDREVFGQILKLASSGLCSNLDGQVMMNLMVSPPQPSDTSYPAFKKQQDFIFDSLRRKSDMLWKTLNDIPGISCQKLEGAMYAFPKIVLSKKAIEAAKQEKQEPDTFYALSLLRETGICCVPGSGFGQEEGTFHLRMTFLPEESKLENAMQRFRKHHEGFMAKYDSSNL